MTTIHGVLERNARKFPEKEGFISDRVRLTYQEMNNIANRFARYLRVSAVKQKSRIAILSRNNEYFFYGYFSLMKLGAIPIPLNTQLTSQELVNVLKKVDADGVLYERDFQSIIFEVKQKFPMNHLFILEDSMQKSSAFSNDNLHVQIDPRDVCEIMFTSGTTGTPKGVMYTHQQLISVATAITYEFQLTKDDRNLSLMPLSHSAPLNTFILAPLYCGATIILGEYSPQNFLTLIQKEKATFTFAAPIAYLLAAKQPNLKDFDLSSMRVFAYGGDSMPLASYHYVTHAFQNNNFYQVYGLTEAGPNGCLLRPEEHLLKSGSIGKTPTLNMEMKVITDEGAETKPGEYGEIIFAGDSVMEGYYNDKEATDHVLRDGWLYTGDVAYRDKDGYFFIVDRKKDIIISGGVNVYPREVEEVLTQHPAVSQACVVGVQDSQWGETIKAVIVKKDNARVSEYEVKEYLAKHLAQYKCPRIYRFVDRLPHNASGKILKQKVKEI